ncbi:COX15/CtaA family protein [Corynebacterium gerontici]
MDRLQTSRMQALLAMLLMIAQGAITVTGSIVRVTGSGLGCNTWPNCHPGSLVPVDGAAPWVQQMIEFGNRLLTFVLVAIAIALMLSVLNRRKEILFYAIAQIVGIVIQAVIGGISVHLDLKWWAVALHFLPSMVLVWLAAVLWVRVQEPDTGINHTVIPQTIRSLAFASAVLLSIVLVTGTMVTGAGVHAGDTGVGMEGRLNVDLGLMAHIHAWIMYVYLAVTIVLVAALVAKKAPKRMQKTGWLLIVMIVVQAGVGILQFRMGVPRWTIPIHIGLCSFVVGTCAVLWAYGKTRVPRDTPVQ